jgi:signal peptidase I
MMVKRVVGLSGDRIAVRYGQVFINGKQLSEVYAHHLRNYNANNDSWPLIDRQRAKEVVVPEDSYFVLGDNRELSADSRVLGPISSRMIIGVVAYRLDVVSNLKGWTRSKL